MSNILKLVHVDEYWCKTEGVQIVSTINALFAKCQLITNTTFIIVSYISILVSWVSDGVFSINSGSYVIDQN